MNLANMGHFASDIMSFIDKLSGYGADLAGGVTRLLYSPAWVQAQHELQAMMESSGLVTLFDDAGNLFGRLEGDDPADGVILTGSHIDTVRCGGKYDGAFGVGAGLIALSHLRAHHGKPKRTLEVVSFAEEEGSRFPLAYWGSGNVIGHYDVFHVPEVYDADGIGLADAMQAAGFGPGKKRPAKRTDIRTFIELHIEQGVILERERYTVGIVDGIVGQRRFTFEVKGEANHAGTTPMIWRRDALAGACEMIHSVETLAVAFGESTVATVGQLELSPNISNVIPGLAKFTLDSRHADKSKLEALCEAIVTRFQAIAADRDLELSTTEWMNAEPVLMNPELTQKLAQLCSSKGLRYRSLFSGAGHDAQMMQKVCKAAMLFVPSRNGVSHSHLEYTEPEALSAAIAVLIELLYDLAYR
ncbi:Zn-dependent hydrolase [Paenibacillus albus]|uniref:Zn-dependent hydrolase n=2 Tax=Paenibacillus albus TaxID=2495582 RepID=A0A3Q8XA19_9BACL|nr:Zn-dependent hydrolase [Paenibacillus albus]